MTLEQPLEKGWYYYTGSGGESTTGSIAELVGATLVESFRDGVKHRNEPSPVGKQIFLNPATGEVLFASTLEPGEKVDLAYVKEPVCNPVVITNTALPDGIVDVPYSKVVQLIGTQPFIISDEVGPAWMDFELLDDKVTLTGTPTASDTDILIEFTITNCEGSTATFSDTIDITEDEPVLGLTADQKAELTFMHGRWQRRYQT